MGFIFGEGTPWTYDEVQRKRKIAEAMLGQNMRGSRNVGEGIGAIGRALAARSIEKRADRRMGELQGEADKAWEGVFGALTGGRTGGGRTYSAPVPPVSSESIEGQSVADDTMRALGREPIGMPAEVRAGVFAGESGGDYDALYGYQNREGGRYAGVKPTDMTVGEVMAFQDPGGDYGQWVKGQVGRVATPVGAYQVVGTTLKDAVRAGVVSPDEKFSPEVQDRVGDWIYKTQGTGAWEGYQGGGGRASPQGQNSLQAIAAAMSNPIIRNDPGKMAILQAMMGQALTPPEQMTPYQQAQLAMREREFQMRQDGTWDQPNIGPEPLGTEGQILVPDRSAPGGFRVEVAPNSKADREITEAQTVKIEDAAKAEDTIALIDSVLNDPALASVLGNVQGRLPPGIPGITGGQSGMDVSVKMKQIEGKAFMEAFQSLKGGGQITEKEGQAAQNAIARLNRAQSEAEYKSALRELRDIANRGLMRARGATVPEVEAGDDGIPTYNPETGMWE